MCWYFVQGMCAKGPACPFRHEMTESAAVEFAQMAASTPSCWYYERGQCAKGAMCTFRHDGNITQSAVAKRLKADLVESDNDIIATAIKVALDPVSQMESPDDMRKYRCKIGKMIKDALQDIELTQTQKPAKALINEYADSLFGRILNALGDRPWIGHVDMLLLFDSAVKEMLPKEALEQAAAEDLEGFIFDAHDRALDEQRMLPQLWEAVQRTVQGPKTRSKVNKAFEAGWKETVSATNQDVLADIGEAVPFARNWVQRAVGRLRTDTGGYPEGALDEHTAVTLFTGLLEGGVMPSKAAVAGGALGPPEGWGQFLEQVVHEAYRPGAPAIPKAASLSDAMPVFPGELAALPF